MLLEVLLPYRLTARGAPLPLMLLAGAINAAITLAMVFAITYAIHRGWDAV